MPAFRKNPAQRPFQAIDHPFNAARGVSVGASELRFPSALDMRVGDHFDLLSDIIKDQERIREQERKVREGEVILAARRDFFEIANHVITQIPDCPSDEPRETGHSHRAVSRHDGLDSIKRVFTGLLSNRHTLNASPARDQQSPVLLADHDRRAAP